MRYVLSKLNASSMETQQYYGLLKNYDIIYSELVELDDKNSNEMNTSKTN